MFISKYNRNNRMNYTKQQMRFNAMIEDYNTYINHKTNHQKVVEEFQHRMGDLGFIEWEDEGFHNHFDLYLSDDDRMFKRTILNFCGDCCNLVLKDYNEFYYNEELERYEDELWNDWQEDEEDKFENIWLKNQEYETAYKCMILNTPLNYDVIGEIMAFI